VHLVGFIKKIYHDARSPERQTLLHVSVLLHHLQGALLVLLLKLWNIKVLKFHKTVDRCMIKFVLLMKCGRGCIWNSKVLFWCVWCATRKWTLRNSCTPLNEVWLNEPNFIDIWLIVWSFVSRHRRTGCHQERLIIRRPSLEFYLQTWNLVEDRGTERKPVSMARCSSCKMHTDL